jgi:[ribosomal protein S18]-alanine N-acetyltransferase
MHMVSTVDDEKITFQIEKASWRDLNAVRHLEQVCFPLDAWPVWDIIGALTLPNVIRLKAIHDGELVGFVACDVRPSEKLAWVATIGVLPEYRQHGVGAALLEASEALLDVERVKLCVRQTNQPAIRLYERYGYQKVSIWPRYYTNGEDALVMEKQMKP